MYKVKQLYVLWESDDGDKKLIPKDEYKGFIAELDALEYELGFPLGGGYERDKEEAQQDIYDLIDSYETLEGEEVFVVLPDDLIKENEVNRPLIVKSDKLKEGLSFDLSHEDVVEQLLPAFEKEVLDSDNLNKEKQIE